MKNRNHILLAITPWCVAAVVLAASSPVWAAINNPADSSTFPFKYEGDAPTTNGNPASGFGNTGYNGGTTGYTLSSDGNILDVSIDAGHANPGLIVYLQSPDWVANATDSAGWTWESSFRMNSGRFTTRIGDEADPHDIFDILDDGRVFSRIAGQLTTVSNITSEFHTYRIAQAPGSDEYNVWIDNALVGDYAAADTGIGTGGPHWWSDGSGGTSGEYEMDYLRFTADGFSPVPEPAGTSLLFIGLIALWRRRRLRRT
ncbi:MAG: PEP-CTERM sorting domain-containing protein [Bythopirellula sp.]